MLRTLSAFIVLSFFSFNAVAQNYVELNSMTTGFSKRITLPRYCEYALRNQAGRKRSTAILLGEINDTLILLSAVDTVFRVSWNDFRFIIPSRTTRRKRRLL